MGQISSDKIFIYKDLTQGKKDKYPREEDIKNKLR